MREYGRGFRLVGSGMGFFDQTRAQIDALIAAGELRVTEGDWPHSAKAMRMTVLCARL
jgi:hypothetical protein